MSQQTRRFKAGVMVPVRSEKYVMVRVGWWWINGAVRLI